MRHVYIPVPPLSAILGLRGISASMQVNCHNRVNKIKGVVMFENPASWIIAGGLVLGAVFGLVVQQFRMCMVAAVGNATLIRDYRYLLGFAFAALTAITGTQLMEINEIVAIGKSSYRGAQLDILGVVGGGLLFGVGATLAGGDAARVVVMAGQGSKAGWVALFFFLIFAAVTQLGVLAVPREYSLTVNSINLSAGDNGLAALLSAPKWLMLVIIDLALLAFIISQFKKHFDVKIAIAGIVLGLTVVGAWYTTGVLAFDEFEPKAPAAMAVSGPMWKIANYLTAGGKHHIDLALAFVIGLFAISLVVSLLTGKFKPGSGEVKAGMVALGGALMGIGGTFAYGCNIGQGFSGLSTLSLESILAVIAMLAGMHFATRWLEKHT